MPFGGSFGEYSLNDLEEQPGERKRGHGSVGGTLQGEMPCCCCETEEEEEGWEEGEEHQAAWLQFKLLRPLHNFWIFSAITMGFSLRIFSAASAL